MPELPPPEGWPVPTRREKRGRFPEHTGHRPRLTAALAALVARARLDQWRRDHGWPDHV